MSKTLSPTIKKLKLLFIGIVIAFIVSITFLFFYYFTATYNAKYYLISYVDESVVVVDDVSVPVTNTLDFCLMDYSRSLDDEKAAISYFLAITSLPKPTPAVDPQYASPSSSIASSGLKAKLVDSCGKLPSNGDSVYIDRNTTLHVVDADFGVRQAFIQNIGGYINARK